MVKLENHLGIIEISENFFSNLVGNAASRCFGVAGMASSQGKLVSFLNKNSNQPNKAVRIRYTGDELNIDLHIIVDNGVNLTTLGESIISRVRYEVNKYTGTQVRDVNVYIDSMMIG